MAEVFGFPISNLSAEASRHREKKICPFNNKVPNCTKDKAQNPLGVCSIFDGSEVAITCPIRFREKWLIADDAAAFFFPTKANWTSLTEVRLKDKYGASAGNIDLVLVQYDTDGKIIDFGAIEIQAVYISGNIRLPFEHYLHNPATRYDMTWAQQPHYPRPDYLSSSRKRLAPQLMFKGGILRDWKKKQCVIINQGFYNSLPKLEEVAPETADLVWFVYGLVLDSQEGTYKLTRLRTVYTQFDSTLDKITQSEPGDVKDFVAQLQEKLDEKLHIPPDAPLLTDPFIS